MKKIFILCLILLSASVFAWDIMRNKKGSLTGYSPPINSDIYKQFGIDLNNTNQSLKSPNVMMDLFSVPQTNYDRATLRGNKETVGGGVGAKTGVTIIYD